MTSASLTSPTPDRHSLLGQHPLALRVAAQRRGAALAPPARPRSAAGQVGGRAGGEAQVEGLTHALGAVQRRAQAAWEGGGK